MNERPHSGVRSHDETSFNIGELQASDYFDRVFTYRNSETDLLAVNSIIGLHSLGFILGDKTNLHFSEDILHFKSI